MCPTACPEATTAPDALALYYALCQRAETDEAIRTALRVLQGAVRLYTAQNLAVAFNGGKDATVVMQLTRAVVAHHAANGSQPPVHCLYLLGDAATRDEFPEVESFVQQQVVACGLRASHVAAGFKDGIRSFTADRPLCAFVMGTRRDDPHGKSMEHFEPSSPGWPPFMRVNPILTWSYHDVWRFLRDFQIPYCKLYDNGYTSIGSVSTTRPNPALRVETEQVSYKPAWQLEDPSLERAGRLPKQPKMADENTNAKWKPKT